MKKIALSSFIIIVITFLGISLSDSPKPISEQIKSCIGNEKNKFCVQKDTNNFCYYLPDEVPIKLNLGYNTSIDPLQQPPFDIFSWQTFVALNWPADTSKSLVGNDHLPRVWEQYPDADTLMHGKKNRPEVHQYLMENPHAKIFSQFSKHSENIELSHLLMADAKPLIDRNLNFVAYERKVNPTEANFIKDNKLFTKEGIRAYYREHGKLQLPVDTTTNYNNNAMEIKSSWRLIGKKYGDDLSKYYTREAVIFVPAANSLTGEAFTIKDTVGLVGMHIVTKTADFPFWIWSTFEHVDNVPENPQAIQNEQDTSKYSFYNPECLNCLVNTPPKKRVQDTINGKQVYKWSPTAPHAAHYGVKAPAQATTPIDMKRFGTQVQRTYPVYYCTEELNQLWQEKLKSIGSVFANYKLIGSQWSKTNAEAVPRVSAPFYLSNTTAETYLQLKGSCISCHFNGAKIKKSKNNDEDQYIKTDLSFVLAGAREE